MVDNIPPALAVVLITVSWFVLFTILVRERARREGDRG